MVIDLKMKMPDAWQHLDIEPLVWRYIILKRLSQEKNIAVSKMEIADRISKLFGSGDRFDAGFYKTVVERNFGVSIIDFEKLVKNRLMIDKLINIIANSTKVSPGEIRQAYILKNTELTFYTIRFKPEDFSDKVTIDKGEIEEYFNKHRENYILPASRRVEYLAFNPDLIVDDIQVSDSEVQAYYEDNAPAFTDGDGNPKLLTEVRETITGKLREIKSEKKVRDIVDKTFLEVAETLDLEKASAGDRCIAYRKTDFFSSHSLPEAANGNPLFAKWAFTTDFNDISEPFAVGKTFFIVKPLEEKPPAVPSLDEAVNDVRKDIQRMKALEMASDTAETMRSRISKQLESESGSFADICSDLTLAPLKTERATRDEALGRGFSSGIVDIIFDTAPGDCGPVKFSKGSFIVSYVAERSEPDDQTIEKNLEPFREIYFQRKKGAVVNEWYASLLNECTFYSFDEVVSRVQGKSK